MMITYNVYNLRSVYCTCILCYSDRRNHVPLQNLMRVTEELGFIDRNEQLW